MAVQLVQKGQADFTQPIELMMDCHRRIEHFLGVLEAVGERLGRTELTTEGRRALETALEYFRTAAPRHSADEEESLFPRLRSLARDDVRPLLDGAARLEREHRAAEEVHERVDRLGCRWLQDGRLHSDDLSAFLGDLRSLRALYAEHIAFEDEQLFPAAARLLNQSAIAVIGREMAARRGLGDGGARMHP